MAQTDPGGDGSEADGKADPGVAPSGTGDSTGAHTGTTNPTAGATVAEESTTESDGTLDRLRTRLERFVSVLRGSTIDVRPYRPEDGVFAEFEPPPGEELIDQYWVNAPYAYVVITRDDEESEHYYYAVEPELDEFELELLSRAKVDIRDPLLYRTNEDPTAEETLKTELQTLLEQYGVNVSMRTFHAILYYLARDFRRFGRIDPLMHDSHIEDISYAVFCLKKKK